MNVEKIKNMASRLLLAFVFVTIGFSMGRMTAPVPEVSAVMDSVEISEGRKVVVYAAHTTFRCAECNRIEWFTADIVNTEFADELESGRLEFRTVDYMRDPGFASRYNILSSTVLIVVFENGEESGFNRLDEVWAKVKNRDAFKVYVREAIMTELY